MSVWILVAWLTYFPGAEVDIFYTAEACEKIALVMQKDGWKTECQIIRIKQGE